jgi:hypothetical protein
MTWPPATHGDVVAKINQLDNGSSPALTDFGAVGDGVTDCTGAWNSAMSSLDGVGGELIVPAGTYVMNGATSVVPGGVTVVGTGISYSDPVEAAPARASVIRAGASMTRLIELGRNPTTSHAADTGASLRNLIVDGHDLATTCVKTAGRRNYIRDCQVYWGASQAVWFAGQNSYLTGGVVAQHDTGDCVLVDSYYDHKIFDAQIRQPGTTGACVRVKNTGDITIRGNHMWTGGNGVPATAAGLIVVEGGSDTIGIYGNILEGIEGPEIFLNANTNDVYHVNIVGNQFFNNTSSTDNAYPVIAAGSGASHGVWAVNVESNVVKSFAGHRYKAFITGTSAMSNTSNWLVNGNVAFGVVFHLSGSANFPTRPRYGENQMHDGTTFKPTRSGGQATFSGTGLATTFDIVPGLMGTPTDFSVTPSSSAAVGGYAAVNGNNIRVTFPVAPASGTNNVVFNWTAGCS